MMSCDDLVKKVRIIINEAERDDDVSLLGDDSRSLNDTITALLPQAVSFIQKNKGSSAGRVNTRNRNIPSSNIVSHTSGNPCVVLPDDFVSLVSLKLNGWIRSVHVLYPFDSSEAMWQMNEYTRAGFHNPACVEAFMPDGKRCALFFPFPQDNAIKIESFVYEACFNSLYGLEGYDEVMVDAVVYMCASLLYTMFERYDSANSLLALALTACESPRSRSTKQ